MSEKKKYGPRVTYDEARPVILNLIAAGKARPSAKDLYEAMGKRGSVATHQKHIDKYRAEVQPIRSSELSMPPDAQEFYLSVLRRQLADAKRELEEELMELRAEKATLVDELEKTSDEFDEEQGRSIDAFAQLQQKLGTIEQLRLELHSAKDETDRAKEEARASIEEMRSEAAKNVEAAQGEAVKIRIEAQDLRTQLVKAELRLEAVPRLEREADRCHIAERDAAVSRQKAEELEKQIQRFIALESDWRKESELRHDAEQSRALFQQKAESLAVQILEIGAASHKYLAELVEERELRRTAEQAAIQLSEKRQSLSAKLDALAAEYEERLTRSLLDQQGRLGAEKTLAVAEERERGLEALRTQLLEFREIKRN